MPEEEKVKISDPIFDEKPVHEKADIKATEIAKLDLTGVVSDGKIAEIEIETIGPIEKIEVNGQIGVQLFAKAWKGGNQLGFGTDGSVEIERFRIFNPPILVDDPLGDIVREYTYFDIKTKQTLLGKRTLREDPLQAILETLVHTIKVVGKENSKIEIGKVGNTTTTLFPAAGNNAPIDGMINNNGATYTTVRTATAGNSVDTTTTSIPVATNYNDAGTYYVRRAFFGFDVTAVGTDTISSATFSLWGQPSVENANSDSIKVVSGTPASQNALVTGDFDQIGATAYASINFASWSTSGYNDFTLDATGITYVNTFYGLSNHIGFISTRSGNDLANTSPGGANSINAFQADQTGTSNDPKLVLVHSSAVSIVPSLASLGVGA